MHSDDAKCRENVDIGHHSYLEACRVLKTIPIRKVLTQLRTRDMRLQHIGMGTNDTKALAASLTVSKVC